MISRSYAPYPSAIPVRFRDEDDYIKRYAQLLSLLQARCGWIKYRLLFVILCVGLYGYAFFRRG